MVPVSSGKWSYDQPNSQVVFVTDMLITGDVIAIVVKQKPDYLIVNNQLLLSKAVAVNDEIHITTFTNHDPDFIRTERFNGQFNNEYVMNRPIFDSAYVWVSYNGKPLTNGLDYSVAPDNNTVIVRKGLYKAADDVILVTSFADTTAKQLTGYKIFRDMLGRTHYKRLSDPNTTELVMPLLMDDTVIVVKDTSVLTSGNPARNIPGIVFIDKERIEFFTINGNELGQLRRGTLGTAPKDVYAPGTLVMDQSISQTVPFKEVTQTTSTYTSTATSEYPILSDYITFNTEQVLLSTGSYGHDYYNQVEVRYNGKTLLKPNASASTQHLAELSYDSSTINTLTDVVVQPGFNIENTTTIVLNFTPSNGARLEIIKRNSSIWYESTSSQATLADNATVQSAFLTEHPAALPATSPVSLLVDFALLTDTGEIITDENGNPLIGA
jgi:hypothetical protein